MCFAPDPTGGVYSAPADPLAGFQGAAGREGDGRGGDGRDAGKRKGREWEENVPPLLFYNNI